MNHGTYRNNYANSIFLRLICRNIYVINLLAQMGVTRLLDGGGQQKSANHWKPWKKGEREMLVLSRRIGESVKIGGNITVTLLAVSGTQARLGIAAPADIPVHRDEVHRRMHQPKVPVVCPEDC
jgi:carbon storage regulator